MLGTGRALTLLSVPAGVSGCDFPLLKGWEPCVCSGRGCQGSRGGAAAGAAVPELWVLQGSSPNLRLQTWVNTVLWGRKALAPFFFAAQRLEVGFPKASWLRSLGLEVTEVVQEPPCKTCGCNASGSGLRTIRNIQAPPGEQKSTTVTTNPLRHFLSAHPFLLPDFHLARLCPFSSFPDVCLGAEPRRGESVPAGSGALGVRSKRLKMLGQFQGGLKTLSSSLLRQIWLFFLFVASCWDWLRGSSWCWQQGNRISGE